MKRIVNIIVGVVVLVSAMNSAAKAQWGSISGTVFTGDNQPAEGVTISITDSPHATLANSEGQFFFEKLSPGVYTLAVSFVGHDEEQRTVTVFASQTTTVTVNLLITSKCLNEVMITGYKNGVKVNMASTFLRTQTPLLELSQNVQVVTSKVLTDQQIISMSDGVLRNVSGAVRCEHWADLYTNVSMRGSQIQAFRNGFNMTTSYWGPLTEDMSFVDRVEFVKGPAGFMISNGDPSGLYNIVTKKPTGTTQGRASITAGSYNLIRTTLDLDGQLNKSGKLLYRLNLAGQNKKSHRDFEFNNRYSIAPVLTYQISEKTKITAEYTYQNVKMTEVGSYYVFAPGKKYATLPRNFTLTAPGIAPTVITDQTFLANLEHQLSANWKLTTQAMLSTYRQQGAEGWPKKVNADGTIQRQFFIWDAASDISMAQAFLNGTVMTGNILHRILGGIDIGNREYIADWSQTYAIDKDNGGEFDPMNPNYGKPTNGYPSWDRATSLEARAAATNTLLSLRYSSAYLQDEIGFFNNKLRLTLAARYTDVNESGYGVSTKANKLTPRAGLSWSIDKHTSVYALSDQSFMPQQGKLSSGGKVKPITGNNQEIGIKKDWMQGAWNTTLAVYRIVKQNELTNDPNAAPNSGLKIELGQKEIKGIEFDIRGTLLPGLTTVANYAFTDGRVTKVSSGVTAHKVGDDLRGYAGHTANAWLSYTSQRGLLKNVGIAGGITWLVDRKTDQWVSAANSVKMPNYFKLDGSVFWENNKLRVGANLFNILDKYLYSGSYYEPLNATYWQSEPGRNARLEIALKF